VTTMTSEPAAGVVAGAGWSWVRRNGCSAHFVPALLG
jgi:hypothetical protein